MCVALFLCGRNGVFSLDFSGSWVMAEILSAVPAGFFSSAWVVEFFHPHAFF